MNQNQGIFGGLKSWFAHPFNSQGSALNWLGFIGLFLVIWWFWNWTLIHLAREV